MSPRDHGTMKLVRGSDGRWRVRIEVDNGLVVQSAPSFDTVEAAKAYAIGWCQENGIQTELVQ
jgi:hypothetical protein